MWQAVGHAATEPNYQLSPRVQHSNFTGPPAMKSLVGQCFTYDTADGHYR